MLGKILKACARLVTGEHIHNYDFVGYESEQYFYLSFAGEERHLGSCFVAGKDIVHAVKRAWDLGINPGGEVLGVEVPQDAPFDWRPHVDKLLQKTDMEALGMEPENVDF